MKKTFNTISIIIITIILIKTLVININATSYEVDESHEYSASYSEYVPDEITTVLGESYQLVIDNNQQYMILKLISNAFTDNKITIIHTLSLSISIILIISICTRIFSSHNPHTFNFLSNLSTISLIITQFKPLLSSSAIVINSTYDITTSLVTSLSSLFLLSGATFSAASSTVSLSLILTIFEQITLYFIPSIVTILTALFVAENLYPPLGAIGLVKSLKKHTVSIMAFSLSFLLAIITLNGSLAASKDTVALRGIKFATSNLIPFIGASVSEAMKTVVAEASGMRNTLGILSFYAILTVTLPSLITLLLHKLSFRFSGICASLLGLPTANNLFNGAADIIDILIAVTTATTLITLFTLFIFTNSIPF